MHVDDLEPLVTDTVRVRYIDDAVTPDGRRRRPGNVDVVAGERAMLMYATRIVEVLDPPAWWAPFARAMDAPVGWSLPSHKRRSEIGASDTAADPRDRSPAATGADPVTL